MQILCRTRKFLRTQALAFLTVAENCKNYLFAAFRTDDNQYRLGTALANSSPILHFHNRRVGCRTNAVPVSSSLPWIRTCEPTLIALRASISTPDELMLSRRPRMIRPFPCARFTGQQMGIRSETRASSYVPIGVVAAATSSISWLVQETLIVISIVSGSWLTFNREKS